MAMIYGREADVNKVRSDEDALREAMLEFVAVHNFTEREQPRKPVKGHENKPVSGVGAPASEPARKDEAA